MKFYTSTTLSLSNSPSNFSYFSSRFTSISRNSTKLDGNLQPILVSLGQFLLTNINFCKWHLLRLVSISAKEKTHYVSIWDPTTLKIYWAKKPIVRNIVSCFCHRWRWHLMFLTSNWYILKPTTPSSQALLLVHLCLQFVKKYPTQFLSILSKGYKCSWHFTNIGYKDFLSYSSIRATPCSLPTNDSIIRWLLNLGFNIKDIILWAFMFSYFFKNERKESSTLIISLLMLKANKNNPSEIMELSSIRLSNERIILFSSFSFKLKKITECKTSLKSPMSTGLVKNTNRNNWWKTIHYNLINVPS